MHKRIQSDKPVVFSFQLQEKEGEKIDEIGQIFKSSRLIKRRTVANEACDAGRVLVNGKPGKGIRKSESGRCDRDSVRYKNGESRSAGYSGYDQERRGERPVPLFIKQKNSFFRYKIIQPSYI